MQEQQEQQRFRDLAEALLPEVRADDENLRSISAKLGSSPSVVKQAGGWLIEKASRLKLGHTASAGFRYLSRWKCSNSEFVESYASGRPYK